MIVGIGFVASFVVAVFVVRSLLDFVSKRGYALFGWWRLVVGTVGLAALAIWG
jgi:undecaprenyl-diphosphatase